MNTGNKTGRGKGLVVGVLVGATLGVLLAPQPGRQTRNLIRRKTGGYAGNLRDRFRRNGTVNESADRAESNAKIST